MNSVNRTSRHEAILRLLHERGELGVEELSGRFDVNSMTIRRDLDAMAATGVLVRTHGGCVLQAPMVREFTFSEKIRLNAAQKTAIARAAVALLETGQTAYLDTGTTALHVARELPRDAHLRVVTNNLRVAMELFGQGDIEVIVPGGTLGKKSPDLTGPLHAAALSGLHFDVAFLGADAIDVARGELFAADLQTAQLSRTAQGRSDKVVFLADATKVNRKGLAGVGRIRKGTILITDTGIDARDLRRLRKSGAEIITVGARRSAKRKGG